jgi:hypothetical protein
MIECRGISIYVFHGFFVLVLLLVIVLEEGRSITRRAPSASAD